MPSNKISKQIEKIPYFDRSGTRSITFVDDARRLVQTIPCKDRRDPATTYQDRQCGTGLDALVLAEQLMLDLQSAIPDESERLLHIFTNQIFLSDIDPIQARIARANIINAVDDFSFKPNVTVQNCFDVTKKTNYTFGSIEFDTTNDFVEHYRALSDHVIVVTKSNKNRYVTSALKEISSYQFLRRVKMTPMCLIHVPKVKKSNQVIFTNGKDQVVIDDPQTVPTEDFSTLRYVQEILKQDFAGYRSQAGPEDNSKFNPKSGTVPLIFREWIAVVSGQKKLKTVYNSQGKPKILMIGRSEVTDNMGYGVPKLICPKNGNPGRIPKFFWDDGTLACSAQTPWIAMSKAEFDRLTRAINHEPCYNTLFKAVLVKTHTKDFWSKIPRIKYLPEIRKIYDKYHKS